MKRALLFFFVLEAVLSVNAQVDTPSISQHVLSAAGNYVQTGGISLSYTVGELAAVQTFTSANDSVILTQGFQQPNDIVSGLLDIEKGANGSFSVYPIPAQTTIWFGYEFNEAGKVEVSLYNIMGQKLDYNLTEGYETGKLIHSFGCSQYPTGSYMLTVKFTSTANGGEKVLTKKIEIVTH